MLALNRQEIIRYKLKGLAQSATSVLPRSNPYFHEGLTEWTQNIKEAQTLMEQSGWKQPRRLKLRSSTDRDVLSWLRILQNQWARIGVEVELESTEFGHFFAAVRKGDFEAFSLRWTAIVDPDILFNIFHSSQFPPGRNRVFYRNPDVDKLLEIGRTSMNVDQRREIYRNAQKLLALDLPYLPLWYASNVAVAQADIQDLKLMPSGAWTGALFSRKTKDKAEFHQKDSP
jgi:peptide/nickel transport system substrate-binding protein